MAERSVVVKLRAEVQGFQRAMADSAASTDKLSAAFVAGMAGVVVLIARRR